MKIAVRSRGCALLLFTFTEDGTFSGRQSVGLLSCDEALAEHQPNVVLCSWMPLGVDWTSSVRACPQVHTLTFKLLRVGRSAAICWKSGKLHFAKDFQLACSL